RPRREFRARELERVADRARSARGGYGGVGGRELARSASGWLRVALQRGSAPRARRCSLSLAPGPTDARSILDASAWRVGARTGDPGRKCVAVRRAPAVGPATAKRGSRIMSTTADAPLRGRRVAGRRAGWGDSRRPSRLRRPRREFRARELERVAERARSARE